jgi:hypothetical protein
MGGGSVKNDTLPAFCDGRRCVTAVTPTICALMGVDSPNLCADTPLSEVIDAAKTQSMQSALPTRSIEKCLVYAPDAIGDYLAMHDPEPFDRVREIAPIGVPLCAVVPSVTPVVYASMFTGAIPSVHGVPKGVKPRPTITIDTIVDTLIRGGKRVAITAFEGSSIDRAFRDRAADYYPEQDDPSVIDRALQLIRDDNHDFILAYNNRADKALHKYGPRSDERVAALRASVEAFGTLSDAIDESWGDKHRAIIFAPDHGGDINPATGNGAHGLPIPENLLIHHYFGIRAAS